MILDVAFKIKYFQESDLTQQKELIITKYHDKNGNYA